MSIDLNTVSLPFDRLGTAATNKRVGERHTLTSVAWTEYNILIPKYAPFYSESIQYLTHLPSGKRLERGIDWIEGWYFQSAAGEIGLDIHCCIYFYDASLSGEVEIPSYQAMGGEWQINGQKLTEILANALLNPLRYYWEQVAELPEIFNPLDHDQDIQDFTKLGDLIDVLREIAMAVGSNVGVDLAAHIADKLNPHKVNAAQVGLSKVMNWAVATLADISAGNLNPSVYMNPVMTQNMINSAMDALTIHAQNFANPHKVQADQTGAYFRAEVDALMESLAAGLIHNLHAYRLEGKSVDDIVTLAQTGSSGALDALRSLVNSIQNELTLHAQRFDNPHKVTAAQVLAYTKAQVDALLAVFAGGTINDIYAFRLQGKSVDDIVNMAVAAIAEQLGKIEQDTKDAIDAALADYRAEDTDKFSGKNENEWNDIIASAVAKGMSTRTLPSIATLIPTRPDGDPLKANATSYSATVLGTFDRYYRNADDTIGNPHGSMTSVRIVIGDSVNLTTPACVIDVQLGRYASSGTFTYQGTLPPGFSLFLDDEGTDNRRQLWLRAAPNRPAIEVTAMTGTGWTTGDGAVPMMEGTAAYDPNTYHDNKLVLTGEALVLNSARVASDARILKLEKSNVAKYVQTGVVIAVGGKLTIDMQSIIPETADLALYDYLGAKIQVSVLDDVTGSATIGSYINSEGVVVRAIRGQRYVDLYNYASSAITVAVRISIPLI